MTAVMEPQAATTLAERIPAWGVSVNLTPSEVVRDRQTKVVQRLVVLGLIVVLLAGAGLTLMAYSDRSTAQGGYDQAQAETTKLRADSSQYDGLVALTRVEQQTQAAATTLMAQDVDFVKLIAHIRALVPPGVTIGNLAVLLAPDAGAVTGAPAVPSSTSDGSTIGTITISGNGTRIKALAPFVASLNHTRGLTDVVPTSTTQTETGMIYSLTMSFTDELYSHRFDQTSAQ